MEFVSDDRESSVTLVLAEVDDNPHLPSIKLAIAVKNRAFYGTITTWFEKDNFQQFVRQFELCVKSGRDSAQLASISPEQVEIHVERSDNVGHFMLLYKFGATSYLRARTITTVLAGGFDLDSEYLQEYASSLEEVATEASIRQISDGPESS